MSTQENKAIVQQFLEEIFNQKNFAALAALVDPEVATHYNQASHAFQVLTAFPDLHITVEDMMTEGDVVVCRSTWRATHQGEYMSIPPTGKVISGRRTDIFRVGGGKIVESRQKWDSVRLMQQLGSDPSVGQRIDAGQEPVLELAEIQGNILPGFHTRFQTLLFFEMVDLRRAREWLREIAPRVTTTADLLPFQRQLLSGKVDISSAIWLNIAFSFGGLHKLVDTAEQFTDPAFKEGMPDRSVLLGDSTKIDAESHPRNWLLGGPGQIPDLCLIVGGNDCDRLSHEVAQIEAALAGRCRLLFKETGAALAPPLHDYEHFGYRDHISQPGVRGRLSERPDDFLTPRQNPANPNQGKPGQPVLWPGEFVFGYAGQDPLDKFRPGPRAEAGPAWARNGSFLVVRRLRQDVEAFHSFLAATAGELAQQYPALADLTPEQLAAKLMGRWFSGAPILRAPAADNPALGQDAEANNAFSYVRAPASSSPEQNGKLAADGYPPAHVDNLGLICPHAAHIRRAYPRDDATLEISEAQIETHRLLRRGIVFGQPLPSPGERGLMFLAYQTSFERQFEFVTRAWLNNPSFRNNGDGYDPIAGQNSEGRGTRVRLFGLPMRNRDGSITKISVSLPTDWVIPTGGGYFFAPSISALRYLAAAAGEET